MKTTEFREPEASQVMLAKIGGPMRGGEEAGSRENAITAAASRCRLLDSQIGRMSKELFELKSVADFLEKHEKEILKDKTLENALYKLLTGIRP